MRGQKFHKQVFQLDLFNKPVDGGSVRNALLDKRDRVMAARYYYYAELKQMFYEACMLKLQSEFFISPDAIAARLRNHEEAIKTMRKEKVDARALRDNFPHLVW